MSTGERLAAPRSGHGLYAYEVDERDVIVRVSDNWQAFVDANGGGTSTAAAAVIGTPIWNYISGMEVRHLYQAVLKAVRERQKTVRLQFRCDAPDLRRYLVLTLTPLAARQIEIESRILRTERRASIDLLRHDVPRADTFITMCSMCKKVKVAPDEWIEVEQAINRLRLFEQAVPPKITHGFCPACFQALMTELG